MLLVQGRNSVNAYRSPERMGIGKSWTSRRRKGVFYPGNFTLANVHYAMLRLSRREYIPRFFYKDLDKLIFEKAYKDHLERDV